jgi:hypothetical protein
MSWPQLLFLVFSAAAILGTCTSRICDKLSLIQEQLARSTDFFAEKYADGVNRLDSQLDELSEHVGAMKSELGDFWHSIPRNVFWALGDAIGWAIKEPSVAAERFQRGGGGGEPTDRAIAEAGREQRGGDRPPKKGGKEQ